MYRSKLFALCALLSIALSLCSGAAIYPKSLATQSGSASTTNLNALKTKDQSGTQDTWNNYVELSGSSQVYKGIFTFDVSTVPADSVCYYGLSVNFKGPKASEQKWQFEWLNQATGAWIAAGDNTNVQSWSWSTITIEGTPNYADLVKNNEVQVRLSSATKGDDCDIDYLELDITQSTSGSAPSQPTQAPSNPTPAPPTTPPTQRPSQPTQQATQRPTERPTEKPTQKPTSAPSGNGKATSAPTSTPSKPTTAPTSTPSKPTTAPTSAPSSSGKVTAAPTSSPSKPTNGKVCAAGTHYRPGPGTTWQWQLSGTVSTSVNVQMYDIDMFDASASLIQTLHTAGRAVTCYIDTAYEPGRPDSAQFTSAVLGSGIDGWPGQKWVDIRSSVVRNIMTSRIQQAAAKGCDAVEMDDVDAYQNSPGFPLTASDQADFNSFLATTAHANDLGIALKNDLDQVSTLASKFDFAINEQCFEYSECDDLKTFITQGKAVFGVEYDLATSAFCSQANADQFSWLKKGLDLDASLTQCCPTCSGTHSCVSNTASRNVEEEEPLVEAQIENVALAQEEPHHSGAAQVSGIACLAVIALFVALL